MSNKKVYNYKVLNLIEIYKFGIEHVYIRDHLKVLKFIISNYITYSDILKY